MAEINDGVERIPTVGGQLRALLLQNIGILVGVAAMFVMAKYAESINFESFTMSYNDDTLKESLTHVHRDAKAMLATGL